MTLGRDMHDRRSRRERRRAPVWRAGWTRRRCGLALDSKAPTAVCAVHDLLHETHDVVAGKMEEFWDAMRGEWQPLVEGDGTARVLWAFELTHGTGVSYQAITITAVRDWGAGAPSRRATTRAPASGGGEAARCGTT